MTLPIAKFRDNNGIEFDLIDYETMADTVLDEILILIPKTLRPGNTNEARDNIEHLIKLWGDDFYQRGRAGATPPAFVNPITRIA